MNNIDSFKLKEIVDTIKQPFLGTDFYKYLFEYCNRCKFKELCHNPSIELAFDFSHSPIYRNCYYQKEICDRIISKGSARVRPSSIRCDVCKGEFKDRRKIRYILGEWVCKECYSYGVDEKGCSI